MLARTFTPPAVKDTVYIYAGEKANCSVRNMMLQVFSFSFSRSGLRVESIDGAGILAERWMENAVALIWGGGESTNFRSALTSEGIFRKDIVRRAHESGVHFAGYCGGGFMGWDYVHFKGEYDYYTRGGEGFGLYPRKSNGAAIGFTPRNFTGMSDSAAIMSLWHPEKRMLFHSLYCCGPYFPQEDMPENAKPLAIAKHPITGQDYVMAVQIPATEQQGSVSLYGYHPEYLADFIEHRTREIPSIALEDERLRTEAYKSRHGILLGFNLMLYDLKTAMGLIPDKPHPLIVPELSVR